MGFTWRPVWVESCGHAGTCFTTGMIFKLFLRIRLYLDIEEEALSLSSSVHVLLLAVITPRDSYTCSYIKLATLLILSEMLVESGFEPVPVGQMRKSHE